MRKLLVLTTLLVLLAAPSWATIARTNRGSWGSADNFGTGTYTVGSAFTPSANSLLVVIAAVSINGGSTDPSGNITVSGGGLTFNPLLNIGNAASWSCGMRAWTAVVGASPPSVTLAFGCGGANVYYYMAVAFDETGYNTGTPTGATASNGNLGVSGAKSITLSGAPAATSEVIGAILKDMSASGADSVTPGSAFSEQYDFQDTNHDGNTEVETRGSSTSTTVDWVEIHAGAGTVGKSVAFAFEIQAASGATPTPKQLFIVTGNNTTTSPARLRAVPTPKPNAALTWRR